jgi:hypothetical protein
MPGFDGTGPGGMGPMSGGGRGYCIPFGLRSAWRPYGIHRWMGFGDFVGATPTREQELGFLKEEALQLERALKDVDARIKELSDEGK